jgi:hypothetical protein
MCSAVKNSLSVVFVSFVRSSYGNINLYCHLIGPRNVSQSIKYILLKKIVNISLYESLRMHTSQSSSVITVTEATGWTIGV